jgi:hypothetical protein
MSTEQIMITAQDAALENVNNAVPTEILLS